VRPHAARNDLILRDSIVPKGELSLGDGVAALA